MLKQLTTRLSSISPRVAIVTALIVVVAVSGVALLLSRGGSEANADRAMQPRAARLERVEGSVGIARAEADNKKLDWAEATVNTPVTVGDRIYARDRARASIALTAHDYVRLNPVTSLDVLSLEDRRTQFALRSGSALFDVGEFASDEFYEVATPYGAVDFREPGLYQVGLDRGNAIISVLSGLAQVVGQEGSGYISKGQVLTLLGATAAQALTSRLSPNLAGNIVDDYYRYEYPSVYDGRYQSYDAYLDDPFYYDPYRTSVSSRYLSADIPGLYDLDSYGDWVDVNDYGHCWAPRVSSGWAPFRSGYWDMDDLWGPSWVSSEPWGWAPYHYGRWAFVSQRWLWVPVDVRARPLYSPAPVAFIPLADQIAWVPLGPGEIYVPRYYENFQPRYLAPEEVVRVVTVQNTFVNFNAPGGVTVVPVRALTRVIDPGVINPVDTSLVGRSRAVLDPFSVQAVRELAIRGDDARRRIKVERREQEALNAPVVASAAPIALPARGNMAQQLRVETVTEKRKENKLKINEAAEVTSARRPDGLPQPLAQSQRMAELASRAEQGDKSARREMRQLMRQEQTTQQQPQAAQQQAQLEQSRQQIKEQRRAERQQQAAAAQQQQQQQLQQQQQMKQQRRAERQHQAAAAQQQQQPQQQQQMKQQRRAERQQQAAAASAQEQTRRAQREQLRQQQQQEQQMRQQRKEQKRKPPEASAQQEQQLRRTQQEAERQAQVSQQRQQLKAQRHAEQQQQAMIEEQNRRSSMRAAQQVQAREQIKAQRHAEQRQMMIQQQQTASTQAAQQAAAAQQQRAPASAGHREDKAQRKAEKAQRRPPQ